MPVVSLNIGPKRVHLTAYCPDDELGLLACEFVCRRAAELLDGTTAEELWAWLIARDPGYAELKRLLDAGWRLPKSGDYTVDPKNVLPELRIIRHLIRERLEQCAGGPELTMGDSRPWLSRRNEGETAKDGPAEAPPAPRGAGDDQAIRLPGIQAVRNPGRTPSAADDTRHDDASRTAKRPDSLRAQRTQGGLKP